MKKTKWIRAVALLVTWATMVAPAQEGLAQERLEQQPDDRAMLINVEQLYEEIQSDGLRILDCRSPDAYARGHVPGALNVDVADWKQIAFDDSAAWADAIGPLGIGPNDRVIVYGDRLPDTGRAWWLLKYVGVKKVWILDGGWDWWNRAKRPIAAGTTSVAAKAFTPDVQPDRLEGFERLKASLGSETVQVIDTRSGDEFNAGRIPGASHIEWTELVRADGRFKTKQQLQALFREKGINTSVTTVCY